MKNDAVVAGGGAIEMEISKTLRDYSRTIAGKEQLLIGAIARALEVIPRYICTHAQVHIYCSLNFEFSKERMIYLFNYLGNWFLILASIMVKSKVKIIK